MELHEEPGLRWYATSGVPFPLFNHVYFTRLAQEGDVDAGVEKVLGSFAERGVPFMWSVGPFTKPTDLGSRLEARGLSYVEEIPGMAVYLTAIKENASLSSALAIERVGDEEALRESIEFSESTFHALRCIKMRG